MLETRIGLKSIIEREGQTSDKPTTRPGAAYEGIQPSLEPIYFVVPR
jgi:hypothetical protein